MVNPSLFPLSPPRPVPEENVTLGCLIRDFFPVGPLKVTWNKSGDDVIIIDHRPDPTLQGPYTMSSQVILPASECTEDTVLTCTVQDAAENTQTVDVRCGVPPLPTCGAKPRLTLLRPAIKDLLLGSDASLTCTVRGLKNPEKVEFTWDPLGGRDPNTQPPELDVCGCYSVTSILPGCAEPWNSGTIFTCKVTHPELTEPLQAKVSKVTENTYRPQVHLLPPPSEELALNELVSLTCLVRGFYPEDVLVRWHQGSEEVPESDFLTWKPLKEPDQGATTYAVTSVLRVAAASWKQGDKYSCNVGHETLPTHFTQKTIDFQSGKPTHVNVSVIVAEADGTCY